MSLLSPFCSVGFINILVLTLFIGFKQCEAADYCNFNNGLKFCEYGCCSNKCCGMSTIAIVGLVIGAVIALAGVVGCVVCLACMCKQSRANRDANTVQPMHNTNSVYVHNSSHPQPRHPPPNYGQYGQYGSYPGSTDPAYPPGPHPPPAYTYNDPRSSKY